MCGGLMNLFMSGHKYARCFALLVFVCFAGIKEEWRRCYVPFLVCFWHALCARLCISFSGDAELGVKRSSHCKPLLGLSLGWAHRVAAIAGQCLLLFCAKLGGKRSSLCRPVPACSCLSWQCVSQG